MNDSQIKVSTTQRGFALIEFTDSNGEKCSLQESSSAERNMIWFGTNEKGVSAFYPGSINPWREISENQIKHKFGCDSMNWHGRMHLNVEQVKSLIPYLKQFVKTGLLTNTEVKS